MNKLLTTFVFVSLYSGAFAQSFVWEESFTGQSNFGNPTGWDPMPGGGHICLWNVYPTHGNPDYGLTRQFTTNQADSISTSLSELITIPLNAELLVDARVMATGALYPFQSATMPEGASLRILGFDGLIEGEVLSMTNANQNSGTEWVTLSGSLNLFAGSLIQFKVVGKNGSVAPADTYFIDLDNFRVTDGTSVGLLEQNAVKCFISPNPSQDYIEFSNSQDYHTAHIFDSKGSMVSTLASLASGQRTDISYLPKGMYYVQLVGKNSVEIIKLAKN